MESNSNKNEMMKLFAQNSRSFSLNLFGAINEQKPNTNLIFSPFSIQTCLAMAFAGAKDKTAEELKNGLLLVSHDRKIVGQSFKNVLENCQNNAALKIANKLYIKTGYNVTPEFNEIATKDFYSEAENLDFIKNVEAADTMNNWVEEKTNGKIKNLISPAKLDADTRMVLINAIYFKASWRYQFKKELTKKDDFWIKEDEKMQVDMMNIKSEFLYGNFTELNATAIEMQYTNSFSMFIILPNDKNGLEVLKSKLKTADLLDLKKRMTKCEVIVKLPKFKVSMEIQLVNILTKMKMGTMFTKEANFNNLLKSPEPLHVTEIVHKAFIEVNEFGSEAAAATAMHVMMLTCCVDSTPPVVHKFIADHPFIYYILDNDLTYFSGTLVNLN